MLETHRPIPARMQNSFLETARLVGADGTVILSVTARGMFDPAISEEVTLSTGGRVKIKDDTIRGADLLIYGGNPAEPEHPSYWIRHLTATEGQPKLLLGGEKLIFEPNR